MEFFFSFFWEASLLYSVSSHVPQTFAQYCISSRQTISEGV